MDGAASGIIGGGPVADLGGLERWWNDPAIAAWSLVFFGCFLLNATLLLAFLVRPGLRTISNRFVMNLTVSNLLTCAVLNPLLMMDGPAIGDTVTMSASALDNAASSLGSTSTTSTSTVSNICAISEGATALVTTSSILSVLLIAIDQYFAVVDPLRYRTRVDKLKSAVLIVSVWLVSAAFSLIAALNPNPRSLWLSCRTASLFLDNSSFREQIVLNTTTSDVSSFDSAFSLFGNETKEEEMDAETTTLFKTMESIKIDRSIGLYENSTVIFRSLTNNSVIYGLIYVVVHSVLAYLLPFAGICWIYIRIYSAAHRNSQRTRRTGSRPILSSASFCEDSSYGCARSQQQQSTPPDGFSEEFRRIPKISSLSSIDETSETTHSANQTSRRRSFSSVSDVPQSGPNDEKILSGVVFTVGLQPMEVLPSNEQDDNTLTEAEELKTELLEDDHRVSSYNDLTSQMHDLRSDQRRSSSHDLIDQPAESSRWIAGDTSDSESEDEQRYGYFDSLKVPTRTTGKITDRRSSDYLLSLAVCKTTEKTCEDAESSKLKNTSEMTTRSVDEEENSVAVKTTEREQIQNEVPNSSGNLENKRSRRPGRRLSRSGISDGNGELHTIVKNAENIGNNNLEPSSCLLTPIVTITPAPPGKPGLHRVASTRSTCSYINSLKHRISNGSLFRYREETRAARVSALVIVMGLICWSPYVLLSVIKNLPQCSDYEFPHEYDVLALSFLILAAYASPLLFGYRSRRVKRELRKFFCFHRELSYKNNRSLMAKKVLKRRHSNTLSHLEMDHRYNIFNCVYGRNRWPKEKVQFVQVPDTALAVETCRSSFSSGASTQISSTSTEEC
ncbi:uncharacterized protein LOC109859954 [Pseudomyrmex gracilis]|uniref:uncharacterized protein LOC109859954 n=1 Tax=Pseudomyrmex gracilis TaxID=219809 RepID=UPI000994EDFE|nr:uncharacterized protein LOC109859954 [Pseudomyrmex gracilis]XP_020294302.1 uncharacterized protein LOC109859954 [Pseudomyrmex gracilis]